MNTAHLFPTLPDDARVWIYVSDRPLDLEEQSRIKTGLAPFLLNWTSHRRPVHGGAEILDGRILVIAGNIPDGDISGCGIDASVRALDDLAQELVITWVSGLSIIYRSAEGRVEVVTRKAFRELVTSGAVHADILVLDPAVATLRALRKGELEKTASASWHAQVFPFNAPSPA